MYVIDNGRREAARLPGIRHETLAGSEEGLKRLSVWRQTIEAGSATPPHRHDCEEVVVVEEGEGELHIDGESHAFGPNTTLVIPANVLHQIVNSGAGLMRLLAVFSTSPVEVFLRDGEALALSWRS